MNLTRESRRVIEYSYRETSITLSLHYGLSIIANRAAAHSLLRTFLD